MQIPQDPSGRIVTQERLYNNILKKVPTYNNEFYIYHELGSLSMSLKRDFDQQEKEDFLTLILNTEKTSSEKSEAKMVELQRIKN